MPTPPCKPFIQPNQAVEHPPLGRLQLVKLRAQPPFQVLQDHGYEADIADPVADKCIAHKFRTQRPQMHHAGSAHEWTDKSDHEIDRMIRRQNTQIANARPEWIPRGQRSALLERTIM